MRISVIGCGYLPRILDGRNALDPAKWRAAGWIYRGLGCL